ncbi:hypothetical protein ACHAXH_006285 [Discostella pseudostelligera]
MSRLCDYSKFDHVGSDTDDDEGTDIDENDVPSPASGAAPATAIASSSSVTPAPSTSAAASVAATPTPIRSMTKKHPTIANRYIFTYDNQKIYEWEQSLEDVTVYIDAPSSGQRHVTASYIVVNISHDRLQVGLKGCDRYFIDELTFDKVKAKESSWYLDEGVITIILIKCFRGQTWDSVLRGLDDSVAAATTSSSEDVEGNGENNDAVNGVVDPFTRQEMQRSLMLERFQEEHPGFDFRDATFNGEVPDPRTFMGGVGYNN